MRGLPLIRMERVPISGRMTRRIRPNLCRQDDPRTGKVSAPVARDGGGIPAWDRVGKARCLWSGLVSRNRCDMSGCYHCPLMEVARRSSRNASVPASPTEQKRVMEPGPGRATSPALRAPREATGSWWGVPTSTFGGSYASICEGESVTTSAATAGRSRPNSAPDLRSEHPTPGGAGEGLEQGGSGGPRGRRRPVLPLPAPGRSTQGVGDRAAPGQVRPACDVRGDHERAAATARRQRAVGAG